MDRESSAFDISERTEKTCTSFTCLVISGLLIVREDTTWSRGNAGISTITTLDLYFGHHVLQRRNHSVNNRSIYDSLCLLLAVNDGVETRAADMYNMFWILAREHGVQRGKKGHDAAIRSLPMESEGTDLFGLIASQATSLEYLSSIGMGHLGFPLRADMDHLLRILATRQRRPMQKNGRGEEVE
jgi:hypothetical protein